jgi:TusA-related sulfurtransferase
MAEIKIRLTDTTSVSEIADFFKGLNDTQTVRARQTKDGAIELYVRGSSKWHLLTDNLKLGFLVTRDYQAAQEKIDNIFKQNGVIKLIRAPQENLTSSFSNHQHDFYDKNAGVV